MISGTLIYYWCRFILWFLLLAFASVDYWLHRFVKPKGWQLHLAIFSCICLYWTRELCIVLYLASSDSEFLYVLVLFWINVAQSMFLGVLMLISSGWCVTREKLGDHTLPIILTPCLNLVTGLIAQYILEYETGHGNHQKQIQLGSQLEGNILLLCLCVNIFTLMYMLAWIFQNVTVEKEALVYKVENQKKKRAVNEFTSGFGTLAGDPDFHDIPSSNFGIDDTSVAMTRLDSPHQLPTEDGHPLNTYRFQEIGDGSDVIQLNSVHPHEESIPPPENVVQDELVLQRIKNESDDTTHLPSAAKLRLINKFYFAVTTYVLSIVAVLLYQIWTTQPSFVLLDAVEDFLLILLVTALIFIFRLRDENPYFVITDYVEELPGVEDGAAHPAPLTPFHDDPLEGDDYPVQISLHDEYHS